MGRTTTFRIAAVVAAVCVAGDAWGWGLRGRKAITLAGLQLIRTEFRDAFKADASSYEVDLLKGAEAGVDVIRGLVPLGSDAEAVAAVSHEIQLLRQVRQYGTGSYFAYRMGVLSALTADVMQPFGLAYSDADRELKRRIDADLDRHVERFSFTAGRRNFVYIRNAQQYFSTQRTFYDDNRRNIIEDYRTGAGFNGFLSNGSRVYFEKAVAAVADAWYSVFRAQGDAADIAPSDRILTIYFVNEIAYLLGEKKNYAQAERVYRVFQRVNPGFMDTYEMIGDYFYAYGTPEARERAVREWLIAYGRPGDQRQRASQKLAKHFLDEGDRLFRRASTPAATNTDLDEALRMFQRALEFDRSSQLIGERINETTVAISERKARYELAQSFIDSALAVSKQADQNRLNEDFAGAILNYNKALGLLEKVGDEFKELSDIARRSEGDFNKNIKDVINEILTRADRFIEGGDNAVAERRFDDGINSYRMVEETVAAIPDGIGGPATADRKREVVDLALTKISDAKTAKQRYEEELARAAAQPQPR